MDQTRLFRIPTPVMYFMSGFTTGKFQSKS